MCGLTCVRESCHGENSKTISIALDRCCQNGTSREVNTWEVQPQSNVKGKRITRENITREEGDVVFCWPQRSTWKTTQTNVPMNKRTHELDKKRSESPCKGIYESYRAGLMRKLSLKKDLKLWLGGVLHERSCRDECSWEGVYLSKTCPLLCVWSHCELLLEHTHPLSPKQKITFLTRSSCPAKPASAVAIHVVTDTTVLTGTCQVAVGAISSLGTHYRELTKFEKNI